MRVVQAPELSNEAAPNYQHEYDGWLAFFAMIAHLSTPVCVTGAPRCWGPLLWWLGHQTTEPADRFPEDRIEWPTDLHPRRLAEISSTCRPELVHALYLADTTWPCPIRKVSKQESFPVTCNGSFFRDELKRWFEVLGEYTPPWVKGCVLVPCAATKPYPSPLHKSVRNILDDMELTDFDICVVSGVIGIAPSDLWGYLPNYDSGLPNQKRAEDYVAWFFQRWRHKHCIVYADFYANAIHRGLLRARQGAQFVLGNHDRDDYCNLTDPLYLKQLEEELWKATVLSR